MRRSFRLAIHYASALASIFIAAPAGAQIDNRIDSPEYHDACIKDATSSKNLLQTGGLTVYTCWGSVAEKYFDFLVSKDAVQTIDKQRTGTYVFRAIPKEGRCWHKTNDADEISIYGCSINVARPPG